MAKIRFDRKLGMLLLAVWLILEGLGSLFGLAFNGIHLLAGVLAIGAGILLIINR